MALREDVQAHWARVETTMRVLGAEAVYDAEGEPAFHTAEEFAGIAVRSVAALGYLWAEGYKLLNANFPEIQELLIPSNDQETEDLRRKRVIDSALLRAAGANEQPDDAAAASLRAHLEEALNNWQPPGDG